MKILHVLDHSIPLHSGYTFRSRAIIEQQRCMGWETYHVTSPKHNQAAGEVDAEEDVDGLHFYRSEPVPEFLSRLPVIRQWSVLKNLENRLDEIVKKIEPDIIHAHSPSLNGKAAVKVGKKYNIPVVYEIRAFWEDAAVDHGTSKEWGVRYRLTRALETSVIKSASAVTTICEGLRQDILDRGLPDEKVTVIPNAVDIDKFSVRNSKDEALLEQLGLKNGYVIGFIGSFYYYEGLHILLQALKIIIEHRTDVRLLLVGGGPQDESLKKLAEDLSIQDYVIFTGRVPHEKVQSYYDLVDIFAYPRLSMRLTELVTPLKPLEAMAQGKLVAASDIGGHRELIRDNVNGVLFKSDDPVSLSDTVLRMISQQEGWTELQKNGRTYVEQERNWPVSVGYYKDVYASVLGE